MAVSIAADAPEMPAELGWVWRCWWRLHHDRPLTPAGIMGMAGGLIRPLPGRIPWMALRAWCEHHGIGEDDMEFLDRCLWAMDEEYLAWFAARPA